MQERESTVIGNTGEHCYGRLNLIEVAEYSKEGPMKKDLMRSGQMDLVLVCFEGGQEIPPHREPYGMQFLVLSGEGTIISGDGEYQVNMGHFVPVDANGVRGTRCRTRMIIHGIRYAEGVERACRT
jgi:quercetin dioxygenase-like cupin family protein